MNRRTPVAVSFLMMVTFFRLPAMAADDAHGVTEWLDVPATWTRSMNQGVVVVMPDDVPPGASATLLIEPLSGSERSITDEYAQAIADLGPWRPVGEPLDQSFENGWSFRFGIGVVTLDTENFTAMTAVAKREDQKVRFWALADSDDTFNHYQARFGAAISSAQDIGQAPTAAISRSTNSAPVQVTPLDSGFGTGVSGAYLGLERGLRAGAGFGSGFQQNFDPSTGRFTESQTSAAPSIQANLSDYKEIEVLFPDGTYRRGFPKRGLMSDLSWDRNNLPTWWGTWRQSGNQIILTRGSYVTSYTMDGVQLISDRDRPWVKLPAMPSIRIEGTFARTDYRDPDAPRIVLRTDGTYEDRHFLRMVGQPGNLIVPDADGMIGKRTDEEIRQVMAGGTGTYTLENYTMVLQDRDGRVWQINAYIPPSETLPSVRYMVINGRDVIRD